MKFKQFPSDNLKGRRLLLENIFLSIFDATPLPSFAPATGINTNPVDSI